MNKTVLLSSLAAIFVLGSQIMPQTRKAAVIPKPKPTSHRQ